MNTTTKLGIDPHVMVQGFLEKQSKKGMRNYFFILRYNKIKNCSSLCCYKSDKITSQDLPKHAIDFYYVTCVQSPCTYTIEIMSANVTDGTLVVKCPDRQQFFQWMSSIEYVRGMSLFTCEKSDLKYSNISSDMLSGLHSLYNALLASFVKEFLPVFQKEKKVSQSHAKQKNHAKVTSAIANGFGQSTSYNFNKDYGTVVQVPITPSYRFAFLDRMEERNHESLWDIFRERYCDQIVFSDREIPKTPPTTSQLRNEFILGENIYGRAYWPHALHNYALGKEMKSKRKRKDYDLIYGPTFRTVHSLFLFLYMKIDGVYQVGEGEINEQYQSWSYANFGSSGAMQSCHDYGSGKTDFWAFDQTIKLHIFKFDVSSNADSWEISAQNFVKLCLQLQMGRNYEVEFEVRFMLKNPSTNMQLDPLFDTKLSEPISAGKFMLKVPNLDSSGSSTPRHQPPQTPRGRARMGLTSENWISRLNNDETMLCDKCCHGLESIVHKHLVNKWATEVYDKPQVPIHLCITAPRTVFKRGEYGIPVRVHVYRDPRHGWNCESVVQLQCSVVLKLGEKFRRKMSVQQTSFDEKPKWVCDYCINDECEDIASENLQAIIINETRDVNISKVPDHIWKKLDRCPEALRLVL
jgi:hypothetical protein